jgi:hypothetical protein
MGDFRSNLYSRRLGLPWLLNKFRCHLRALEVQMGKEIRDGVSVHGLGEKISLAEIAASAAQFVQFFSCLQAFRNHLDLKRVGHGDD